MKNRIKPLTIIHNGNKPPGKDIPEILDRLQVNVGCLRPNEVKLLTYYANQGKFSPAKKKIIKFSPAKKTISKATGIDPGNIKRYRRSLHNMGLIVVSEKDRTILVNWPVILCYASLDEPLPLGKGKRSYFHPCEPYKPKPPEPPEPEPACIEYLRVVNDYFSKPFHNINDYWPLDKNDKWRFKLYKYIEKDKDKII